MEPKMRQVRSSQAINNCKVVPFADICLSIIFGITKCGNEQKRHICLDSPPWFVSHETAINQQVVKPFFEIYENQITQNQEIICILVQCRLVKSSSPTPWERDLG